MANNIEAALLEHLDARAAVLCFRIAENGTIARVNRYAEKLLGKEIVGTPFQGIFFGPSVPGDLAKAFSKENKDSAIPLTVKTKDNLPRTFYFTFMDLGGVKVAFGEANHEELDKLPKHFIRLNNELNNLTRELQKKNAELAQLNAIKNRFLGMAAHDLRYPMICIKEFSSFLSRENLTEDQRKVSSNIQELSGYMSSIVANLLDISKIEAGVFDLNKERIGLQAFLGETITLNNIMARKKEMEIRLQNDARIAEIWADKHKLAQVLNNLLSNAIKFSNPGNEIIVRAADEGNEIVSISVKDHGVGIPIGELDSVFKPFQKLSAKATRGETSTGLGMVIVKNIVEAHGGKIRVESEPSKGTTVSFTIPRSTPSQESAHG